MMTIEERATANAEKLRQLLFDYGVKEKRVDALNTVIENVAWMEIKLEDARAAIKTSSVAIAYDNGGGQKGVRENPLFKGYESLFKSYMAGLTKILDLLPPEEVKVDEEIKPKTVLELVRAKHESA